MVAETHINPECLPTVTEPEQTSESVHRWLDSPDYQTYPSSSPQDSSSNSLDLPTLTRPRAYSATPSTQPHIDSMSPSSRSSNRSSTSLSQSQESYASGKFTGRGVFKPAGNAQYNFIVQRFKHRKEDKAQKAEQRPQLTAKNLKKLG